MSWLTHLPFRVQARTQVLEKCDKAAGVSLSPPSDPFAAELAAYREKAARARRASQRAPEAKAPTLRPYGGVEHLLTLLSPPHCGLCDKEVAGVQQPICPHCEEHALSRRTRLSFGEVWSPFQHNELSRRAVTRLKYHGERWRGFQLAQHAALSWLAEFDDGLDADDMLIAIPLSTKRIQQRGFNQAQVLVRGIQQRLRLRSCESTLFRHDQVAGDQKHRSRAERLQVRDQFYALPKHEGKRVWLVDDVITTGATLEDAARSLERAGLLPVGAVTLTWTL